VAATIVIFIEYQVNFRKQDDLSWANSGTFTQAYGKVRRRFSWLYMKSI
jgi:hypothetical protein